MGKPTDLFRWADAAGAVLTPPAGKRSSGWLYSERPPPKYLNWLFNGAYQWHAYLDNLHAEIDFLNKNYAWTGAHTWGASFAMGGGVLSGAGGIDLAGTIEGSGHVIDHPTNEYSFKTQRGYTWTIPFSFVPDGVSPGVDEENAWAVAGGLGAYSTRSGRSTIYLDLPHGGALVSALAWVSPAGGSVTMELREEIVNLVDGTMSVSPLGSVMSVGATLQPIGIGPLNVPINNINRRYAVSLVASVQLQTCSAITLSFYSPGPRGGRGG